MATFENKDVLLENLKYQIRAEMRVYAGPKAEQNQKATEIDLVNKLMQNNETNFHEDLLLEVDWEKIPKVKTIGIIVTPKQN